MPPIFRQLRTFTLLVAAAWLGPMAPTAAQGPLEQARQAGLRKSVYRTVAGAAADRSQPGEARAHFAERVAPILRAACAECHGEDDPEADLRIDALDPDLRGGRDVHAWQRVFDAVVGGEMPPGGDGADRAAIRDRDRSELVWWLAKELQVASRARAAVEQRSTLRRMTGAEFGFALQDLLGVPGDFAADLEAGVVGQLQASLAAAREALSLAVVSGDPPPPRYWSVSMRDAAAREAARRDRVVRELRERHANDAQSVRDELERRIAVFGANVHGAQYVDPSSGRKAKAAWNWDRAEAAWRPSSARARLPESGGVYLSLPASAAAIVELGDQLPDRGVLRVRVRAWRADPDAPPPSLQLGFGWQASDESMAKVPLPVAPRAVTACSPHIYQWDVPLRAVSPRNAARGVAELGGPLSPSEYLELANVSAAHGAIHVDHVEVIAPLPEAWPPASHRRIFDVATAPGEVDRARQVFDAFLTRAWRRAPDAGELGRRVARFERLRPHVASFEAAVREVLAAALVSPNFVYFGGDEAAGAGLATRLSMFLWSSIPDRELLELDRARQLTSEPVLADQVERMLRDPRSQRFVRRFVRQWLGLQAFDQLVVAARHPDADDELLASMAEQPVALFEELLGTDGSVLEFLHADYVMVDQRLARHYGIDGVSGDAFRKVPLTANHRRGGLLAQAALLAMNSDGGRAHPLKRGVWVLDRLLGSPPPPPPAAAAKIDVADPAFAGLSLAQQLAGHRSDAACWSCHQRIDPLGLALERFDALGRFRPRAAGAPVDAVGELPDGRRLDGIDGLKRYLLEHRQDAFVRAMVQRLMEGALGRPLAFADRAAVEAAVAASRRDGDGLRSMIVHVVLHAVRTAG